MKQQLSLFFLSRWAIVFVILLSIAMHLRVFNLELVGFHVWRQTQTQVTIESFAEEDINILNPRRNERGNGDGIFRMEFPLAQWITALPVRFFEDDVFVSRLVNFLFGLISVLGIYLLASSLFRSAIFGLAASWMLTFTPGFYYYTLNPMPDNLALALSIWGLLCLVKWYRSSKTSHFLWMIILFSLAGLCKLPFALFFVLPFYVLAKRLFSGDVSLATTIKEVWIFFIGVIPPVAWYLWVIPYWEGNGIVSGIFSMDEEQKSLFWYYTWFNLRSNIPEVIIGIPAVPLFITGLISAPVLRRKSKILFSAFAIWLVLITGLLVFEMNMIEKVHDYYLLPYVPVFVLLGVSGLKRLSEIAKTKLWVWPLVIIMILGMPFYSWYRINPRWQDTGFNEDLLIYKDELRAAVPGYSLVCAGNDRSHHIFLYYIDKKGWSFEQDWMGPGKLDSLVGLGCEYLYCDSRHVDQNPDVQVFFGMKVAAFGSINIFKLKNPATGNEEFRNRKDEKDNKP